ncbi:MAG: phospholipase D-like domain-containing protein [Pseudonocardiaceae bacterium]
MSTDPASIRTTMVLQEGTSARLWFTPTIGQVDLQDARDIINTAEGAILFLLFNPGTSDTLLNRIIEVAEADDVGNRLYIRGIVNHDPSAMTQPVRLFDQYNLNKAYLDVVSPATIDELTRFFRDEPKRPDRAFAMVHSKVILIDPFSVNPIVLTGSHNLGPKASKTNDENLVIIRDAPGLAVAYTTNIMAIYNHYRWRFRRHSHRRASSMRGSKTTTPGKNIRHPGNPPLRKIDFRVERITPGSRS